MSPHNGSHPQPTPKELAAHAARAANIAQALLTLLGPHDAGAAIAAMMHVVCVAARNIKKAPVPITCDLLTEQLRQSWAQTSQLAIQKGG